MIKTVIIDDNYEFVESVFNFLTEKEKENIKILKIFSNGENALKFILDEEVDVILLDLNLPKINGIELIQKIQKIKKDTKIIAITGDSDFMKLLIENNIKVYNKLFKPFKLEKLILLLDEIESSSNSMKDNIIELLNTFSFNKNTIGYFYLIECIEYCLKEKYQIMPCSKIVYSQVAKLHNHDNYLKIGWNIDKTIKLMNKETKHDIKYSFLDNNFMPSTKYFINCMIKELNNKYHYDLI